MKIVALALLSLLAVGLTSGNLYAQTIPTEPIIEVEEYNDPVDDEETEVLEPIITKVVNDNSPILNQITPVNTPDSIRETSSPILFTNVRTTDRPFAVSGFRATQSSSPAQASNRPMPLAQALASPASQSPLAVSVPSTVEINATYPNQTAEIRNAYIQPNVLSFGDIIKPLLAISFVMLILTASYFVFKQSKTVQGNNRFNSSHA